MKPSLSIQGIGAISPAGAGSGAILAACRGPFPPPAPSSVVRELDGTTIETPVFRVAKDDLANLPRHPRIRRSSPITKYAISAGLAALEDAGLGEGGTPVDPLRTGLVFTFMNGCVSYTNRFYGEVLDDPKLASPILFPETVFNAPGSHLATFLGISGPCYTLVGDASCFFSGLEIAELWLNTDQVDRCLVIAAEETDWLSAEALRFYSRRLIAGEGGAAVVLAREGGKVAMESLSGPHVFHRLGERDAAVDAARAGLPPGAIAGATSLVDARRGVARLDRAEQSAWSDWEGERLSPYLVLGDAMGAGAGLQFVAAAAAARDCQPGGRVLLSNPGSNLHAFAASLVKN